MWFEIRRVYAGKPITIPLLDGGITDIEGIPSKNYTEFLKCILCTLRSSKFQAEKGITIIYIAADFDHDKDAVEQLHKWKDSNYWNSCSYDLL